MSYYDDSIEPSIGEIDDEPDIVDDTTWTTQAGVTLAFYEMETSHLENTIAMLERKGIEPPYLMERELYMRKNNAT